MSHFRTWCIVARESRCNADSRPLSLPGTPMYQGEVTILTLLCTRFCKGTTMWSQGGEASADLHHQVVSKSPHHDAIVFYVSASVCNVYKRTNPHSNHLLGGAKSSETTRLLERVREGREIGDGDEISLGILAYWLLYILPCLFRFSIWIYCSATS